MTSTSVKGNVRKVAVALAQITVQPGHPAPNLDRAVNAIEQAARAGCALVVLPECLDFGWTDPSARDGAQPIPGPHAERLQAAAGTAGIHVCAGLVERSGWRLYNAAILIAPTGEIVLRHRKINEVAPGRELYAPGRSLAVGECDLGTVGISICADNLWESRAIGHALCHMGAEMILSPSCWAVAPHHDEFRQPYGNDWVPSYTELARDRDVTVIGVSNVGPIEAGPWRGQRCIGRSLAVAPGGAIVGRGPYGAEALVVVDVGCRPPFALNQNPSLGHRPSQPSS